MSSSTSRGIPMPWVLVCPRSTMYLLSVHKRQKKIMWSSNLNIKVCDGYRGEHVQTYITARPNDKGGINLYLCSPSNPNGDMIDWKTNKDLETYVTKSFNEGVKFDYKPTKLKIDNSGKRGGDCRYEIVRHHYMISENAYPSVWHLDFSKYVVSYLDTDGSMKDLPVYHALNEADLINRFQELKEYKFCMGDSKNITLEDICVAYELQRGKISIHAPPTQLTGRTDVFNGKYMEFNAAIKKMKTVGLAKTRDKIVLTNLHQNMCRFFDGEIDANGSVLFAFEHCTCNLHYSLRNFKYSKAVKMDLLRGVLRGIHHLHKLNLVHQNITPWRVLISHTNVPKLCGAERWEALSEESNAKDQVALGLLICYFLSKDKIRSEFTTEEEYLNSDPDALLGELRDANPEAYHLANMLVHYESSKKPSTAAILAHLSFWKAWKKINFIAAVNGVMKESSKSFARTLIDTVNPTDAKDGAWKDKFPEDLVEYMEKKFHPEIYDFHGPINLIKFLRNLSTHRGEMKREMKSDYAQHWVKNEDNLVYYISKVFPQFLSRVQHALEKVNSKLPGYYD